MSKRETMTRTEARHEIIQAANRHVVNRRINCQWGRARSVIRPTVEAPFSMRHIQRAVFVCRQNGLVRDWVIERAGYRV